jgi:hypothetical protein
MDKIKTIQGGDTKTPQKLYKYRCWNDIGKKILSDNRIYLASPRSFNDTLDCNVPQTFPPKEALYSFFYKKSKEMNPHFLCFQHAAFARKWAKESPLANPVALDSIFHEYEDKFMSQFGVFSATENPNNGKMWNEYSDSSSGICIGFDYKLLFEVVGGGGPCIYVDQLPVIEFGIDNNTTQFYKRIIYKKKQYKYEQEYRLHKMWPHTATERDRAILLEPNTIIEVIIGKNMTPEYKAEVREMVESTHPNARIIEQ